ncbi:hypothetical protein ABFS82_01G024500 [Erythranthe guttata]|uniref:Pentacotripeptide-repeat region of PRORP domain-containing protein n=1 Tax=Erythranthe guttata TaxID=4155 RepID=A0A022Q262_ERYGU|nr:PREDICTED: putative pentatricopeptide repeat-containing protein At3g15130 [Erythranthe guttata]EYU21889.1 hypothetical protein MIMGU_mgv1a024399mg [Erythranthe guttata]|eukprot:XP_012855917.1 PREDICTED: putative pentatricopeptide repeat-containing protein At3g15130 [Erythranthe guttata]
MRGRQSLAEILRKCSRNSLYDEGRQVHGRVFRIGYEVDLMINNDLIEMYRKCSREEKAHNVFDIMPERNVVSWSGLMCAYLQSGNAKASLLLYKEMGLSHVRPNEYILSTNVKACALLSALQSGKQIHAVCSKTGFRWYPVVGNSIVDMYFKCGRIEEAEKVFEEMPIRSLITWNAMIAGYASLLESTSCKKSLHFVKKMQESGETPDEYTFSSSLKACSILGAIRGGRQIHAFLIRQGVDSISTHEILSGALVDFYAQCGCLLEARAIFTQMERKSLISWTALMVGYARKGYLKDVVTLFKHLMRSNIPLDSFVLSSITSAFADLSMVELGKQIHSHVIKNPSNSNTSVENSILNMYLKCGSTEEARKVFRSMRAKNVVSYTVMITGYGENGFGKEAVRLFEEMEVENIEPDSVTYLAVLSACSHSGLVEESLDFFSRLCDDRRVKPSVEHYACMVDVLGRVGRLEEAKELIEKMPLRANVGIWQTLLNGCRLHKNVEMGRRVGDVLLRLDGENLVNYVLISNMLSDNGFWRESERLREVVKGKGLKKEAACSW